jgi:hypothetical protein
VIGLFGPGPCSWLPRVLRWSRLFSKADPGILERHRHGTSKLNGKIMNQIVYIVGAIVIVLALLGFLGIR